MSAVSPDSSLIVESIKSGAPGPVVLGPRAAEGTDVSGMVAAEGVGLEHQKG